MPIYEYKCESCERHQEVLQKHTDPAPECTSCSKAMTRQVSAGSFTLKGTGWARDNYGLGSKA
jgi:putative FmdB family regulatory protein